MWQEVVGLVEEVTFSFGLCASPTNTGVLIFLYGEGYFDVRDRNEAWIRVWVKKGGMIVLPAGIYHRFTLDSNNYIKVMTEYAPNYCLHVRLKWTFFTCN